MRRALRVLLLLIVVGGAAAYLYRVELGLAAPAGGVAGRSDGGGGGGGRRGRGRGPGGGNGEGPVSVLIAPSRRADVPVVLEAVGTAQALGTVTVRSQVDGRLLELGFREGQDVKAGDVIARIDPTIYQAQYDQAVAKKAQGEANLANARIDLERYANLARTNYGSKQQADTQRASVAQLQAQSQADQGAVDNARAYLDYTTVRAPIDGRTGIRLVDAGNLVRAADTTGIVVVTQLRPISVVFNLPQQNLRAVNTARAAGPVAAEALEADGRTSLDRGTLEVVDNQVDSLTGTVKLRAVFPNATLQLWPGSFVNVRLVVDTLREAVVVPTGAVQRGPTGAFVYGVADGKAVLKPVTIGRETDTLVVIASGVTPPEPVVTSGFARLTDGERVEVSEPVAAPDAAATTPAPPARRERRRRRDDGTAAIGEGGSDTPNPGPGAPAGVVPRGPQAGERRPAAP